MNKKKEKCKKCQVHKNLKSSTHPCKMLERFDSGDTVQSKRCYTDANAGADAGAKVIRIKTNLSPVLSVRWRGHSSFGSK